MVLFGTHHPCSPRAVGIPSVQYLHVMCYWPETDRKRQDEMGYGKMLAFRGRFTNQGRWSIGPRDVLWDIL